MYLLRDVETIYHNFLTGYLQLIFNLLNIKYLILLHKIITLDLLDPTAVRKLSNIDIGLFCPNASSLFTPPGIGIHYLIIFRT